MKVRDIMTADVATATSDTTLQEIATMMRDHDTGAVPVLDGDELIGLVTDRDIVMRCVAEGRDPEAMTADGVLSEELETIEPDTGVEEAVRLMSAKQIRRLPVVENGRLVGMLSLGDIAVKASEDQAGDALEDVSRGVKPSRGRPQPGKTQAGRRMGVSPERRIEQERGASRLVSGDRNAPQGIANRNVDEEVRRQSKVVPIRNQGKTTRKRRAS